MPPPRWSDRLRTRRAAEAMMSPAGILLAGVGVAASIVVGLPLVVAPVVAVAAWAARVVVGVGVPERADQIDPFTLPEPWRGFVRAALQAQARFDHVVDGAAAGPLRDRLGEVGARVADGTRECWNVARRAAALEGALVHLDAGAARAELEAVRAQRPAAGSDLERTQASLQAQVASAERLERAVSDAAGSLRLLDARLDEAVARAVELSVGTTASGPGGLGGLGADVDGVVSELEALRAALDETGAGGAPPR